MPAAFMAVISLRRLMTPKVMRTAIRTATGIMRWTMAGVPKA